jgi:oligopeptide transport system substrate-binding protein
MKRLLALMLSVAMAVTMFAGCGMSSGSSKAITACIASEPKTIDPSLNNSVDGGTYINCAFEGLTTYNKEGKIVEGAAEKWETSADGLVWTFHIRKDAKWSDGKDVTAKDFVYAWRRTVDPATAADYAYYLFFIKNGAEINAKKMKVEDLGVKAVDDKTLEVTLVSACSFFTEIVAFPALVPQREDIVSNDAKKWSLDTKTYIGNGPYVLKSWEHDSKITFEKSNTYWNKASIVAPKIEWYLMSDGNAILGAFKNKQVSLARNIPPDEYAAEKAAGTLQILPQLSTYYLDLNNSKPPFDNAKVRKAVSLAIDRNYIVEKVTKGGEVAAGAYVPFGIADVKQTPDFRTVGGDFYSVKKEDFEKNVAEAKKLLAEAGYPDGKGFPKVTYGINTDTRHQLIAEAVQQMLKKNLNINVEIQAQEWNVFQQSRKDGVYNINRNGWIGDYMDPSTFTDMFTSDNGQNNAKYKNPKYDADIAAARKETDPAKRMQILHDAEKLMMDEAAIAPLFFYTDPIEVSTNLQGYVVTKLGFIFLNWASYK